MEAVNQEQVSVRDVLAESLKQSAWLLGIALVFIAYARLMTVIGDDIARWLTPMFHPAIGR